MRHILIVATTSYAGMGPYVSEIVNTFTSAYDIYYLFREYEDIFFQKNIKEELISHSTFYKRANSDWNKLKDLFISDRTFERIILEICKNKKIEVVHFINSPVPIRIARKLEARDISTLGTVHDLHFHEAKKAIHKMVRHKVHAYNFAKAIERSKSLVTNSEVQFKELQKLYPKKKIFFHAFPSLVSKKIVSGHNIPQEIKDIDNPYILFFGRIEEYKGVSLLYNVFVSTPQLYNNYKLVIAGKGNVSFRQENKERSVVFLNRYIKDTEIRSLFEKAKCVVYPYISATQSGVLSLSYYFNTPVLASDVPFFSGIINSSHSGLLFKTGHADDLRDKLNELLTSDTAQIKKNGHEYYHSNYRPEKIRESLMEIYTNLIYMKTC